MNSSTERTMQCKHVRHGLHFPMPTNMTHIANRLTRLIACVLALTSGQPSRATSPTALDTGYQIVHSPLTRSLYWLDNRQLLFAGTKTTDMQNATPRKEESKAALPKKLYLLDVATNSTRLYANSESVCVTAGVISYKIQEDKPAGRAIFREGRLGLEQEVERPLPSPEDMSIAGQSARVRSNFTCKTHLRNELSPPAPQRRGILVLREGDGYLDTGPQGTIELLREIRASGPGNILLFRPGSSTGIKLPITLEQGIGAPIFSEFLGAYVTLPRPKGSNPGLATEWPRDLPFTIYSFKATGEMAEIAIPYGDLVDISWTQPTRAGWIFGGGNFYKSLGLYLFNGKTTSKLDAGAVREIAVSPDGCTAAVGIQNKHLDMGTPVNLRTFNFCIQGQ